ncbi:MAG: hypothetical protein EBR62_03545 [Verrucomicrobia bacterium]|nr:hypothetical protein [Verrucomicrobiota bacterium]
MPSQVTIRGASQVINNLRVLGETFPQGLGRALYRFAEADIVPLSKQSYAPVVTGTLRSSIRAEPPSVTGARAVVQVAAGGGSVKYGLAVHENPRAGHTQGFSPSGRRYKRWSRVGEWKFIETPVRLAAANGSGFAREAGVELQQVIRGLRG